jgi:predicted amidohydrolase YtcJ
MKCKRQGTWLVVLALCFASGPSLRAQKLPDLVAHYADIVLVNGKVHTVDKDDPSYTVAEAVAIRDGRFLAVGPSADILALAGPNTVRIDLEGRTVTPGFVDTHSHLMGYAEIPPAIRADNGRLQVPIRDPKHKPTVLQEIEAFAKKRPKGTWIEVGTGAGNDLVRAMTLEEMDRVAPNNPLYIGGTPSYGAMNSLAIQEVLKLYPDIDGIQRHPDGRATGQIETPVMGVFEMELMPPYPVDVRVAAYKKEMDRWLGTGITTFSSRVLGFEISAYTELERRGLATMRFGYSHGWLMDNPNYRAFVWRLGDTVGQGSDTLWNVGVSITSVDGTLGDNCVSIEKKIKAGSSGPRGDCRALPGMPRYEAAKEALRHGVRISGVHAAGDRSVDALLDLFLELQKEGVPMAKLRPNLDHCTMVSGDNLKKAAQIKGMMFSCAPKYVLDTAKRAAQIWDKEIANNWVVPAKSMLDAGVKMVWEVDDGGTIGEGADGYPIFHPMLQMQILTTRKDEDGNVWGARQALDKKTALLTMTRRGAEYVLREDRIGSIEPGKLADLVVLDGDWLTTPEAKLVDLAALLTIVGGKVVYADPAFAAKVGSALDRVQHPHGTRYPAYRANDEVRKWAER